MKRKLNIKEYLALGSMLFGLFFGAGNLIFPVYMGQMAGKEILYAIIGFLITGVGLPILGVAAIGISHSKNVYELSSFASKKFGLIYTCLLYLTIGPLFAIPRCATTSFTVGLEQVLPLGDNGLALFIFTLVFFLITLLFSLKPNKVLTNIGKILNPCFLIFLSILIIVSFINHSEPINTLSASGNYIDKSFITGFLEGYNTMDALASLAFGVIIISVIEELGIKDSSEIAISTIKSGILSGLLMSLIYILVAIMGTRSLSFLSPSSNGGIALGQIAKYYLGEVGLIILAIAVSLACLKTAVGLIVACSEMFITLFPYALSYKKLVIEFCTASFLFANIGLDLIIEFSLPVLMFLYPLTIVLIVLSFIAKKINYSKTVYRWTLGFTIIASLYDLFNNLPSSVISFLHLTSILETIGSILPLSSYGLGWILPSLLGLFIGLIVSKVKH